MPLSTIVKQNCKVCNKTAVEKNRIEFGSYKLITLECGHVTTEEVLAAVDYSSLTNDKGDKLMPFQIDTLRFAEQSDARCLIAHEQGLGKTVIADALLKLHWKELTPAIIVTKTTLKAQWMYSIVSWTGEKNIQTILSGKEIAIPGFDIYVTTYDMLKNVDMWKFVNARTLVLDECQAIKNHLSGRAKAVQKIGKDIEHIIGLSGTPIKNHAGEYFTILNLLQPTRFPEFERFLRTYCDSYETMYGYKVGGLTQPDRFREATKDFIIRYTQEEVLPDLFALKKPRKFQHVELDKKFNSAYEQAQRELEELFYKDDSEENTASQIAVMTKMRKICGLSKVFDCVDYVIDHILSTERKIVIFAHHHSVVDLLEQKINEWLINGSYNKAVVYRAGGDKERLVSEFSAANTPVMICSTLAAGEGLDGLQHICNDMIMLERQWNPANEEQVEGRLARIGQTKPVNFIYMIATGKIDEYFTELVEQKRAIVAGTLDGKEIQWEQQSLMKELAAILVSKGNKRFTL